jgi:hypothetical protein
VNKELDIEQVDRRDGQKQAVPEELHCFRITMGKYALYSVLGTVVIIITIIMRIHVRYMCTIFTVVRQ